MPTAEWIDNVELDRLKIVFYPDPILRKTCRPVERFDVHLRALVDRMFELMREDNGIGLAAPQVGLDLNLFICNPTAEPEDDMVCVNPELSDPQGSEEGDEGCLSLPGVSVPMTRAAQIVLRAQDATGTPFERTGHDLLARVWQHEHDHLHGRLIIDHMSETVQLENRRALKQLKDDYDKAAKTVGPRRPH